MPTTLRASRPLALILAGSIFMPMAAMGAAGCGNNAGSGGGGTPAGTSAPVVATNNTPAPGSGAPMMAGGTNAAAPTQQQPQQRPGMSTKEKVVLLAGAALLYYLYKKHQAAEQQQQAAAGQAAANGAQPQLYQSKNGGIYYRKPDANHTVVWLTAPGQGVSVPASDVQQYEPNYAQYQNQQVPAPPAGAQTQSATQYDPSLASASQ